MNKHLSSFIIQKHKSIEYLEIKPLGRINLFVGENSCGKTTVLEAILKSVDPDYHGCNQMLLQQNKTPILKNRNLVLFDDIDKGLHYNTMVEVWKMIKDYAIKLDVQVFATAHSYECVQALEEICDPDVSDGSQVILHRIEKGNKKTVRYLEDDICFIVRKGISCL